MAATLDKGKLLVNQEQELIERAQAGDREAFCLLARGYERRIYALAFHFTRNPHDAEDLSQEVWLKAYRAIGSYRGEASFYTWLRQIAVNTLMNQQRRGLASMWTADKKAFRLGELVPLDQLGLAEPAHQTETGLHQKMMVERVMGALEDLSPKQRMIFLLKHREGMTYEEISKASGTSAGTIKKALFRTVNKLRERLGIGAEEENYSGVIADEKS
ncbi:MAG TPA: sigma-70 family RNA polymerase sigma factor [Blastocatellia bacterium]|nr:sigma-70 family RNA polymerase sigma factor [Blastocatellia bacterium]HMY76251.1 sigma-70 family RNA polymerase sigma factor [Blastocatellia bacterium]